MTDYNPDIIKCPFCDEIICDDENEIWNHCDHLFSAEDECIEWGSEYEYMYGIAGFFNEYQGDDEFDDKIESLLENLKIKKELEVDCVNGMDYGLAQCIEDMCGGVFVINQSWDADRPGGSGTYIYFFIEDIKKIQWIFDEFKILHSRLMKFDKDNNKRLN